MIKTSFNALKLEDIFPQMENILRCGAYTITVDNCVMECSHGVYKILGAEPNSIKNYSSIYDFIDIEDRDRVQRAVKSSILSKVPYKIEFCITDAKGRYKRLYSENYMRFNEKGELTEYSGIIKDITEKYFITKELENKIEALNRSNDNLQEFVYVASHDLHEPV